MYNQPGSNFNQFGNHAINNNFNGIAQDLNQLANVQSEIHRQQQMAVQSQLHQVQGQIRGLESDMERTMYGR